MSCQTCKHPGGADYLGRGRTKIIDIFRGNIPTKNSTQKGDGVKISTQKPLAPGKGPEWEMVFPECVAKGSRLL